MLLEEAETLQFAPEDVVDEEDVDGVDDDVELLVDEPEEDPDEPESLLDPPSEDDDPPELPEGLLLVEL